MPVCFAFNYPFVFSSVLSFAFDRLTFPFFVQFPICPFIYLVIRLLFVRRFIHFPTCLHCVNLSVFSFVLINSVIHPLIRSISHPFFHLFGHSCTHCLSSFPMVHRFGRFRLSDRTFAYPLNYSSSYRSFHSSEW